MGQGRGRRRRGADAREEAGIGRTDSRDALLHLLKGHGKYRQASGCLLCSGESSRSSRPTSRGRGSSSRTGRQGRASSSIPCKTQLRSKRATGALRASLPRPPPRSLRSAPSSRSKAPACSRRADTREQSYSGSPCRSRIYAIGGSTKWCQRARRAGSGSHGQRIARDGHGRLPYARLRW